MSPLVAETPWFAPAMFALGIGMLAAILLRRNWRLLGKQRRGGAGSHLERQPRPKSEWDGVRDDAEARFDRQQVELHELARDLTGQIDSKLALLRQLVAQSDQQIKRLEELLAEIDERRGL